MVDENITKQHKISELRRELQMRRRVYPRFVEQGRMTDFDAKRQIAILESILRDYDPPAPTLFDEGKKP